MKNFVRPEGEKPYYYSTTVENGEIVRHDFDEAHAVDIVTGKHAIVS